MKPLRVLSFIIPVITLLVIVLPGCRKEGCTDIYALNFDPLAKTDDGSCKYTGKIFDIQGNEYKTIKIGNQLCMAENLRTSKFCNGDIIPNGINPSPWVSVTSIGWSYYNNDSKYEQPYGKLYNWYAVNDSRNICPCNWHVPTAEEWQTLSDFLGGDSIAGSKMKVTGNEYWKVLNEDATNESGFAAVPGGYRGYIFKQLGSSGWYWTSTEYNNDDGMFIGLENYNGVLSKSFSSKELGMSIRCVMD